MNASSAITAPVGEKNRIASLDVLRGFAVLGILLLNIIGFGLVSVAYSNPGFDVSVGDVPTLLTWASVELLAEGAMRCLFSVLFGAGVVLFTTGAAGKSGWIHYRRTLWLLMFGLVNAYILLWYGDILVTYALAGALLYLARGLSVRSLLVLTAALVLLVSAFHGGMAYSMQLAREAHHAVVSAAEPEQVSAATRAMASQWQEFIAGFELPAEQFAAEVTARTSSYGTAFAWNFGKTNEMLLFVVPVFLFWDALMMMTLGMALYKGGVLQGERSVRFYVGMIIGGFSVGLLTNSYEIARTIRSDFDIISTLAQMQPTYHLGRLGMAMGYLGLLVLMVKLARWQTVSGWLENVGRLALTNYLMQSLLCAIIFTGAGLGLLGEVTRPQLYGFVFGIWVLQIAFSKWWLEHFIYGPLEWLWRALTYGVVPEFRRHPRATA